MEKRFESGSDKVYVGLDSYDSREAKRHLLEISAAIVKVQMINQKLIKISGEEIKKRKLLKGEINGMFSALNEISKIMPKVEIGRDAPDLSKIAMIESKTRHNMRGDRKKKSFVKELMDIRQKLSGLKN